MIYKDFLIIPREIDGAWRAEIKRRAAHVLGTGPFFEITPAYISQEKAIAAAKQIIDEQSLDC